MRRTSPVLAAIKDEGMGPGAKGYGWPLGGGKGKETGFLPELPEQSILLLTS